MIQYEEKMTVLKILPSNMRDHLLYRAMDDQMSYEAFRDVCIHRVSELKFLSGSHKALVAHDEELVEPPPELSFEDEDALAARFEKKGWKVVPPSRLRSFNAARPAAGEQTRPGGAKCINCGGAHATRDCTRGRVEESERPCWGCGQKGHKRSACPTKPSVPRRAVSARAAAEEPEREERAMTCTEEGMKQTWSRPRALKISDFIHGNAKSIISENEKDDMQKVDGAAGRIVQCSSSSLNSILHDSVVPKGPAEGYVVSAEDFPPLESHTRQMEKPVKSATTLPRTFMSYALSNTNNCSSCSNNSCVQRVAVASSGVPGGGKLSYRSAVWASSSSCAEQFVC